MMCGSPALLLDREAPVYTALTEATGRSGDHGVCYATDAGWLQAAGFDCVVYGPGDIGVAHKPNESVPVKQLELARDVVEKVVRGFCREGKAFGPVRAL